ncbi:MAG TPA: glycosyltransferase family 87 protein [Candidatus Woesebacteria bacterium]|nr:glycosyltransferase family 87 protein [Candidatus Woesebacteria bacterium]
MGKKQRKNNSNIRNGMLSHRWFIIMLFLYGIAAIGLFLYSFFQIDLNLTIINHSLFLEFQKPFIEFGYYNRPDSVRVYIGLLLVFFGLYLVTLRLITLKKITYSHVWLIVILLSAVLFLSYPASFSHDIFNYMFDARIVTEYGQNPYFHKAMDYPSDPWIRFLHWTHRTYPYGPIWLLVTIPLSYIGVGKFLIIMLLFKLLVVVSYLVTSYFIYKILQKINADYALLGVAFFALNPLVILESLVSAHNDVLMMALSVVAVYLLVMKKRLYGLFLALLSVGVKFTTVYLLPFFVIGFRPYIAFLFALATFSIISYRIGIQPWYFLWVMPFAAVACMYRTSRVVMICMTFVLLLRYIPFIESGSWYPSAIPFQYWTTVSGIVASIIVYIGMMIWSKVQKS